MSSFWSWTKDFVEDHAFHLGVFAIFIMVIGTISMWVAVQPTDKERELKLATETMDSIHYTKDPRTKICFAYLYDSGYKFTAVPCEFIPPELLAVPISK